MRSVTKFMNGSVVYVYKGTNYLERPDKTNIKKMLYDDEEHITYVYCKKPSIAVELICTVIIIALVVLNRCYIMDKSIDVYFNRMATIYDNYLYLNLKNPDTNIVDISYTLLCNDEIIASGVISPGQTIIRIMLPTEAVSETYTLRLEYPTIILTKIQEEQINAIDRRIEYEGFNYD